MIFPQTTTWIELSEEHVHHNAKLIHTISKKNIAAVLKSNAYGHGLLEFASIASRCEHITHFCVFSCAEALTLKTELSCPQTLIVLGAAADDEYLEESLRHSICISINDIYGLKKIITLTKKNNFDARITVKIDSGLGRLGLREQDLETALTLLQENPQINLYSVMTHLSHLPEEDCEISSKQLACFDYLYNKIQAWCIKNNQSKPLSHVYASSGLAYASKRDDDLIRVGSLLYGFYKSPHQKTIIQRVSNDSFKPVLSLKTRIMSIKHLPSNCPISYGAQEYTTRESAIAYLPCGYMEGYPQSLGTSKMTVLINGAQAPLIGCISMNVINVDVTAIPGVQIGDEVTLFGSEPATNCATIAALVNKKPIEITTSLCPRLRRITVK